MKSIWKKAALAVLAGAMAFSFTGCGGEKKAEAPAAQTTASPLVNMLRDAFLRAANNKTAPAADKPAEAADAPEVVE